MRRQTVSLPAFVTWYMGFLFFILPILSILFKAFQQDVQDGQDKSRRAMNCHGNRSVVLYLLNIFNHECFRIATRLPSWWDLVPLEAWWWGFFLCLRMPMNDYPAFIYGLRRSASSSASALSSDSPDHCR